MMSLVNKWTDWPPNYHKIQIFSPPKSLKRLRAARVDELAEPGGVLVLLKFWVNSQKLGVQGCVLISVKFGCFSPSRFSHFQREGMSTQRERGAYPEGGGDYPERGGVYPEGGAVYPGGRGCLSRGRGCLSRLRWCLPRGRGVSIQREWVSTQREGVPTQREGVSTQREGVSTQKEGVSTQREEVSTQRDGVSTQVVCIPACTGAGTLHEQNDRQV